MADKFWRGSSDTVWTNTNNWAATRYGATGDGEPASNDDVYFLDPTQFSPAGLSKAAVDLNSFTIGEDYNGSIGSAGAPLVIAVSGTTGAALRFNGSGQVYITAGTNGIDRIVTNPRGSGKLWLTGGTTVLFENTGPNEVMSGATVTTIEDFGGLTVNSGAANTTLTVHRGASTTTSVNTTTINCDGNCRVLLTSTVGTLNNRGTYEHQSSGTITTANAYPGSRATSRTPHVVTTLNKRKGAYAWDTETTKVTVTTTVPVGY